MEGLDLRAVFSLPFLALLLITIIFIYKSKMPWTDNIAKILIWTVFGVSLLFKLTQVAQMLLAGQLSIPFMVSFGIVYVEIFFTCFGFMSKQANILSNLSTQTEHSIFPPQRRQKLRLFPHLFLLPSAPL